MWSMLSLGWSALGGNKVVPWIVLGLVVAGLVTVAYLSVLKKGADSEKMKQLAETLNKQYKEARRRADIQALNSKIAREQLARRWSE